MTERKRFRIVSVLTAAKLGLSGGNLQVGVAQAPLNKKATFATSMNTSLAHVAASGAPQQSAVLLDLRTIILILLASSMGLAWLLEQPGSSQMEWHPRFAYMIRCLPQAGPMVSVCVSSLKIQSQLVDSCFSTALSACRCTNHGGG